MSLDGYMTAADQTAAEPTGKGGMVLLDWAFGDDPTGQEILASSVAGLGAVIAGRVTYDHSVPWWGADGPSRSAGRPVFVVTHQAPAQSPEGGVYEFVTGGIEEASPGRRGASQPMALAPRRARNRYLFLTLSGITAGGQRPGLARGRLTG